MRKQNLAKDVYKDPKNAEMIRKLESLEIKDGKIILKVRAKARCTSPDRPAKKEIPGRGRGPADVRSAQGEADRRTDRRRPRPTPNRLRPRPAPEVLRRTPSSSIAAGCETTRLVRHINLRKLR